MTKAGETKNYIDEHFPQFSGVITGDIDFIPLREELKEKELAALKSGIVDYDLIREINAFGTALDVRGIYSNASLFPNGWENEMIDGVPMWDQLKSELEKEGQI
jgi:hypothetical protein